ncbi:MAG: NAD(P)H-dependent oxidoreductase [Bacilli bacterium]|nr:NAD(P)H-dependent oxidoreductase [Bacilli bacterium]
MKKIGIIVGSLRKDSFSGKVAQNLETLLQGKALVKHLDISHLPLYNQDFDGVIETPKAYDVFRAELAAVDSVIVITPEHNRTMPAALKNALDVGSRPWGKNLWNGKKYMVVGVSPGTLSGFGAATDVRTVLNFLNGRVMNQPEVYLGSVHTLLDEKGVLVEGTLKFLSSVMDAFVNF